eukprot:4141183-Prymnesium_polylepis.1
MVVCEHAPCCRLHQLSALIHRERIAQVVVGLAAERVALVDPGNGLQRLRNFASVANRMEPNAATNVGSNTEGPSLYATRADSLAAANRFAERLSALQLVAVPRLMPLFRRLAELCPMLD